MPASMSARGGSKYPPRQQQSNVKTSRLLKGTSGASPLDAFDGLKMDLEGRSLSARSAGTRRVPADEKKKRMLAIQERNERKAIRKKQEVSLAKCDNVDPMLSTRYRRINRYDSPTFLNPKPHREILTLRYATVCCFASLVAVAEHRPPKIPNKALHRLRPRHQICPNLLHNKNCLPLLPKPTPHHQPNLLYAQRPRGKGHQRVFKDPSRG